MNTTTDLNGIWLFVQIVQAGSISGAAKLWKLPKSTVSFKLKQLERHLGVTLIKRTTRKLQLTEAGELYYAKCNVAMLEIDAAEQALTANSSKHELHGTLKISAPVEMGSSILLHHISGFRALYPHIHIELTLTDQRVDLIAQHIDLAIRIGPLPDSTLIAKKIGAAEFQLYAAPQYLIDKEIPLVPNDLIGHQCIQFSHSLKHNKWTLYQPKQQLQLEINIIATISVNNLFALRELTVLGHGISMLPQFMCTKELEQQQLVRILPSWQSTPNPVSIVYPNQDFVPPKVKAFVAYLSQNIQFVF